MYIFDIKSIFNNYFVKRNIFVYFNNINLDVMYTYVIECVLWYEAKLNKTLINSTVYHSIIGFKISTSLSVEISF